MSTISLLNNYRCTCGKLLLKGILFDGILEIKCKRCGEIVKIGESKLVEDSNHYLLIIDDKGIITNASDSILQILGYYPEEIIGKSLMQLNSSLPKEIGIKFFGEDSLINMDSCIRLDTVHKSKSGDNIPVSVVLRLYSPTSQDKYILEYVTVKNEVVNQDVSSSDSSQFIENTCDYYFDIDKNGVVEHISETMEKLFQHRQERITGKNYFDFLPFTKIIDEKKKFTHFSTKEQSYRVVQDVGLDSKGKAIYSDLYFTTKFNEIGNFGGYRVLGWITHP